MAFAAVCASAAPNAEPDIISRRIAQLKSPAAQAWTKISWAASLLDARRSGREERRPVFLFSYEGNLDTGRC
jgi:hypothetical protein